MLINQYTCIKAKISEVKNELNVSDLVKKAEYFTTSDYNIFTNNILHAKVTPNKLANESGLNEKIKSLATEKK